MQSFLAHLNKAELQFSSHDQNMIDCIDAISGFLETHGFPVAPFSFKAAAKFRSFEEARKQKAVLQLMTLNKILNNSVSPFEKDLPKPHDDIHPEKSLVETAMRFYNLKLRDDFWAKVSPDDILEIYNDEGIQVFRTFNFFNASSYSLTDLLVNEWYVLWERPKFVLQKMFEYSNGIMSGEIKGVVKMDIAKHIVKEIYSASEELVGFVPRSTLVEFGHICPLYNSDDDNDQKVRGIIVSSRGYPNTLGSEDTKKVIVF